MNHSISQSSAEATVEAPVTAARRVADKASTRRVSSLYGGARRFSDALGQSLTWLCGGALAFNLLLVLAVMARVLLAAASRARAGAPPSGPCRSPW